MLAALGLSAIVTEIIALVNRNIFNFGNFFSFFTILSNVLSVAMFALFGYGAITKRFTSLSAYVFKGAVTLYMLMTGMIFAVLLAPIENAVLTAVPWDNIVLHYIMPLAICVDWILLQPKVTIKFSHSLMWLSFPATYVIYSLVRGHFVHWYPYPFLNASVNGYAKILTVIAVLLVVVTAGSQLIRITSGRFGKKLISS